MNRTCTIRRYETLGEYKSPFIEDEAENLLLHKIGKFGMESYKPGEKLSKAIRAKL